MLGGWALPRWSLFVARGLKSEGFGRFPQVNPLRCSDYLASHFGKERMEIGEFCGGGGKSRFLTGLSARFGMTKVVAAEIPHFVQDDKREDLGDSL
jgi:hypothetical protein